RTLQVRLRFDNPDERMKPNMYAQVTIFGKSHPAALSIPREAVIRGQDIDRVVVALGDGKFTVHEVMTGIESGGWLEIIAGLDEGDEVVTSAQFLIESEARLAGSSHRLDTNGMTHSAVEQRMVYGNGIVKAVDIKARRIRVSHGPIEALGWTPMTMEFDVLPGVNLEIITIGQSIHFSLDQTEVGDYVIDAIHQPEPAGIDDGAEAPGEHIHQQGNEL
ncbi:MAG: copper-binding protein, partial [Lysobacterales bacterium]